MTLTPGTKLGPYEIVAPLGAGGMGEVYRARDTRLGRDVAVKALPDGFERDPERVARFEREAKLLASLHHPNVGSIFGLEDVEGLRYLVLEFVDGETLSARLARGPLPIDEAMAVCAQIATAVEAAHEAGVIHRDLKPGNVMLKPDGTVKVLDFGLAKTSVPDAPSSAVDLAQSPTMTYAATGAGVILGTAAYMSPEQARGKSVDRRTDIWSFGCVLFECIAGRQVFAGETVSDLVAHILTREPDWAALPPSTPQAVVQLLHRCLTKNARERLRDIGEARIALGEAPSATVTPAAAALAPATRANRRGLVLLAAAALAGLALGALAVSRLRPAAPAAVTRLSVLPPSQSTDFGDMGSYALSPNGRTLVFALPDSSGTAHLFVRPLDRDEARALDGTDGASFPGWSPDSRDIAFFAEGHLRRVPVAGGAVRTLCEASNGRGVSWGSRGTIVFAPDPHGGIWAVDAAGGTPRVVTALDSTRAETSHRFPSFLPDGQHFLFIANPQSEAASTRLLVGSTDGSPLKPLGESGMAPVFAAPDRVVFTNDNALLAQRIDLRALQLTGEPRLLGDQPEITGSIQRSPVVSCSRTGDMVFTPRDPRHVALQWVDADGRATDTRVRFPAATSTGHLSPDGRRYAVMMTGPEGYGNAVGDLATGTTAQIATMGKGVYGPVWNPAGTRLFGSTRGGMVQIDPATGADSLLDLGDKGWRRVTSWSADGRTLLLESLVEGHQYDIETLTLAPGQRPRPYRATLADESSGHWSHDGRLIAFTSDASGRPELFVERYPDHAETARAGVGALSFSSQLLHAVAWRADDRELYFLGGDGYTVYAMTVNPASPLSLGTPRAIRHVPRDARDCMITDDGRVLVLVPDGSRAQSLTVVQGWMREAETTR